MEQPDLRILPARDLGAAAVEAQWQRIERILAHERALDQRPAWQRFAARSYSRVVEPVLLVLVSGYYLLWALLHCGPWLR
jgi:hypothetical protein